MKMVNFFKELNTMFKIVDQSYSVKQFSLSGKWNKFLMDSSGVLNTNVPMALY